MTRRRADPAWLDRETVERLNLELCAATGGLAGLRDLHGLESALWAAQATFLYGGGDLFDAAASYARSLCLNHPFHDGNKRAGLAAAAIFLRANGWQLEAPEDEAVERMLAAARGELSAVALAAWLRARCVPCEGL